MHVYVPLEPVYTYRGNAHLRRVAVAPGGGRTPDLFTTPRTVSKRQKDRVYFDYMQIAKSKTIAAPYVLRAYPGSAGGDAARMERSAAGLASRRSSTIENARERFAEKGDLFAGVLTKPQRLEDALERLEGLLR